MKIDDKNIAEVKVIRHHYQPFYATAVLYDVLHEYNTGSTAYGLVQMSPIER